MLAMIEAVATTATNAATSDKILSNQFSFSKSCAITVPTGHASVCRDPFLLISWSSMHPVVALPALNFNNTSLISFAVFGSCPLITFKPSNGIPITRSAGEFDGSRIPTTT
jgi:hypothetical protein